MKGCLTWDWGLRVSGKSTPEGGARGRRACFRDECLTPR